MKHKLYFTFDYPIITTESFTIDINKLSELLVNDFLTDQKDLDVEWMIEHFGDNIEYYLFQLGFSEEVELDENNLDYIYDSIYEDLESILNTKVLDLQKE